MNRAKYPKARQADRVSGKFGLTGSEASELGFSSRHRERLLLWCSFTVLSWVYIAWTMWGYNSAPLYGSVEGNRALMESSPIGTEGSIHRRVWSEARSLSASFSAFIDGDLRRDRFALEDLFERKVEARMKASAVDARGDMIATAGAADIPLDDDSERLVLMGELERAMRDVVRRCTVLLDETFDPEARSQSAFTAMTMDVERVIELLEQLEPDSATTSSQWSAVLKEAWRVKEVLRREWDLPILPEYGDSNHG